MYPRGYHHVASWHHGNPYTWAHSVQIVPKCMSCHKTIAMITKKAYCFHDSIYIYMYVYEYIYIYVYKYIYIYIHIYIYIYHAHLASVRFEHSVCHGSLMTTSR